MPHFVARSSASLGPAIVSGVTYALLSHLPTPLWLNRGLALGMEAVLKYPPPSDSATLGHLARWWTPETIQSFWTGGSFYEADWQPLSNTLAYLLVQTLAPDYARLVRFANAARYEDAGLAASMAVYGKSLGLLPQDTLGPGDWAPKPDTWVDPE